MIVRSSGFPADDTKILQTYLDHFELFSGVSLSAIVVDEIR